MDLLGAKRRGDKKKAPAPEAPGGAGPRTVDLRNVPVLVIDDDPASAKLLAVVLGSEGCEVQVAGSAEEALRTLTAFQPRVIIVDLILPLMSGLLFAQQLRAQPGARGTLLIAVSAFNGF